MNIKNVGHAANLIAALGVVVSLLFVAYEVNQNTEATLAANRHSVITDLREGLLVRARTPSLGIAIDAARSGKQMTPSQESQYRGYLFATVKSAEDAFARYVDGQLDQEYLNGRIAGLMIPDFLGNEVGRDLYEGYKRSGQITAQFAQAVDQRLAERDREESHSQ